jgi:hypothetical protein
MLSLLEYWSKRQSTLNRAAPFLSDLADKLGNKGLDLTYAGKTLQKRITAGKSPPSKMPIAKKLIRTGKVMGKGSERLGLRSVMSPTGLRK